MKAKATQPAGETPAGSVNPQEGAQHATPAVRITARRAGFRRCGIAHAATPTDYPAGHWSPAELDMLVAEPELQVEPIAD